MHRKQFEAILTELWLRLGLSVPVFGPDPQIFLMIDKFEIMLRQGEDHRTLVIEADAGPYFADSPNCETVMAGLLKIGLVASVAHDLIVMLERGVSTQKGRVLVKGYYRHNRRDVMMLTELIFEAVATVEALQRVLATGHRRPGKQLFVNDPPATEHGCIVFKP